MHKEYRLLRKVGLLTGLLVWLALAPGGKAAPRLGGPDLPGQAISAGNHHSCALQSGGNLLCWGNSDYGQTTVPAGSYTQVSASNSYTCGLQSDGGLLCWGRNDHGQTDVPPGSYTQVSAGGFHTCGLKVDGSLLCWGQSTLGRTDVPAGSYTQASAGYEHTCGLQIDGTLLCWGSNSVGQTDVPPGSYTQVSAGYQHTCGLQSDGTLVCWGRYTEGQVDVPLGSYTQVSAGTLHTCGLQSDGALLCWGASGWGQTDIPAGTYTQVSAGGFHTCGLQNDGTLLCWGSNSTGQTDVPMPYGTDADAPSVSGSLRADADPTTAPSVDFTVTFNEFVVGVDVSDFSLTTTGGISGATVTSVVGAGKIYTVSVDTGTGEGTIRLDVLVDGSIRDGVNLPLAGAYTGGEVYTISAATATPTATATATDTPTATHTPVGGSLVDQIVDDQDPGFNAAGGWVTYTTAQVQYDFYMNAGRAKQGGDGSATGTFTPNLPEMGEYEVFAWLDRRADGATNLPYTIYHSGGPTTVTINTRNQPPTSGGWISLGSYNFPAGASGQVVVSDDASGGWVIADAVRWYKSGPQTDTPTPTETSVPPASVILDNAALPGGPVVGGWTQYTNTQVGGYQFYGGNGLVKNAGSGGAMVTFQPTLPKTVAYEVFIWVDRSAYGASDMRVDVHHAGGTATAYVNFTTGPASGGWISLGTYTFNAGTGGYVVVTDQASGGQVVADAVRWVEAP